ncbi:MAG: hypothetical protein H6605_10795 [Flavobacteriales bacterium]|nr:hypothetical protein [Flavobacteriales bacterium]
MKPYFIYMILMCTLTFQACQKKSNATKDTPDHETMQDERFDTDKQPTLKPDTVFVERNVAKERFANLNSLSPKILYRNCQNLIKPILSGFEDSSVISLSATNAFVEKTGEGYLVIPDGVTCRISLSVDGEVAGEFDYKVIAPPKPRFELTVNGKTYDGMAMFPKQSRVQIKMIPDLDFRLMFPEDAIYQIGSVDVFAQLSLGPAQKVNSQNLSDKDAAFPINVMLGTQVKLARPGTIFFLRFNDVVRRSRNGKIERLDLQESERTFALIVK